MSFLAPAAFALAALAGPLIALYMLRSRRSRMVVPSIILWEQAGTSVSAALPWQRLKMSPLLILQLVVLGLFVLALARPFLAQQTELGPHTVMVIDTSGSMAMADRWNLLEERALSLAEDVSRENIVSVVEAGPHPRVLTAFSSDPLVVADSISSLSPGGGIERLDEALRLARGLETPDRPTKMLVLSDGGPAGTALESEPILNADHIAFTDMAANVGISAFSTEPTAEGATRIFLELANWSDQAASRQVEVAVNDLVTVVVSVNMEPLGRSRQTIPLDASPGDTITAHLLGDVDGLALDDTATISVSRPQANTVAVVGEGSAFLTALVDAAPFGWAGSEASDLLIVDGGPLPDIDRPTWLIRPDAPPPGITTVGTVQNVGVTFQQPGEPILDQVDLSNVVVAEAQLVESESWFPMVRAGDVPLILLGTVNEQRVVYFTFDITHSNLPLQIAFPVMGTRILEHLAGGGALTVIPELAGVPAVLSPPEGARTRVIRPDGLVDELAPGASLYRATEQVGRYVIEYVDASGASVATEEVLRRFAPTESAGDFHDLAVVAPPTDGGFSGELVREWVAWFLAALLVFLALEWWIGHRRPVKARSTPVGSA